MEQEFNASSRRDLSLPSSLEGFVKELWIPHSGSADQNAGPALPESPNRSAMRIPSRPEPGCSMLTAQHFEEPALITDASMRQS